MKAKNAQKNHILAAALRYARRYGWHVLPLEPRGKKPLTKHGYKDATIEEAQIRKWWAQWPNANVAIVTGKVSNLVVVDVDGPSGRDELARLEREFGDLAPTLEATSGRPHRRHLYFKYPASGKVPRQLKVNGADLDILGDGGYVVAPPSIHPKTQRPYEWTLRTTLEALPDAIRRVTAPHWRQNITHRGAVRPLAEAIPEGERDVTLASFAGTMRRRGASEAAILAALRVENDEKCVPPLDDKDLKRIAKSIGNKPTLSFALSEPITDINLARRFALIEQNELRYSSHWRKWLVWDGRYWAPDVTFEVHRRIEAMVRGLFDMLTEIKDNDDRTEAFKRLNTYMQHHKLNDVEARARTQAQFIALPDQLDRNPWLFNVQNGTLNLQTGKLQPHNPSDLITKIAPTEFNPHATAPRWNAFLREITSEDSELPAFLQQAVGYTLAGVIREHVLFFCYGSGANGKTTFLEVLHALFGDYAVTIDFETLLHHRTQTSEARRDLPRLHKARLVSANETPTHARWDERTVKQLTGGDTLSGRWLYQEKFEFTPTHTLWCRANDQPDSHDLSEAFWRRVRLIPFKRQFVGKRQITDLKEQLLPELPGILNWALAGCRAWQQHGLPAPARVEKATTAYRREQDVYGQFLAERCRRVRDAWTETGVLYQDFETWYRTTHGSRSFVPSLKAFGKGLAKQRDLHPERRRHEGAKMRGWTGVAFRDT